MNNYFEDLYNEVYEYTYDVITEKEEEKSSRTKYKKKIKSFIKYVTILIATYKLCSTIINKYLDSINNKKKYYELKTRASELKTQATSYGINPDGLEKYIKRRVKILEDIKNKVIDNKEKLTDEEIESEKHFLYCINLVEKMKQKDMPLFKKLGVKKDLIDKLNKGWDEEYIGHRAKIYRIIDER